MTNELLTNSINSKLMENKKFPNKPRQIAESPSFGGEVACLEALSQLASKIVADLWREGGCRKRRVARQVYRHQRCPEISKKSVIGEDLNPTVGVMIPVPEDGEILAPSLKECELSPRLEVYPPRISVHRFAEECHVDLDGHDDRFNLMGRSPSQAVAGVPCLDGTMVLEDGKAQPSARASQQSKDILVGEDFWFS